MKTMTIPALDKLLDKLSHPIKSVHMSQNNKHGVLYELGVITVLATDLGYQIMEKEDTSAGIFAFTVDAEYDLTSVGPINSPDTLKEAIQENEDNAIAYVIAIKAPRIIHSDTYKGGQDGIEKIISSNRGDDLFEAIESVEGLSLTQSVVLTIGTKQTVWSAIVLDEKQIEVISFSDWDGESDIEIHTDSRVALGSFVGLFKTNEHIPFSDWKHCIGDNTEDQKEFTEEQVAKFTEEKIAHFMHKDGHKGWHTAYLAFQRMMSETKLTDISRNNRINLMGLFKHMISQLEVSMIEDDSKTHKAPERVQ